MELSGLRGAVCVVTGAAQGIGEGVARTLADSGARLALMDANREQLTATADSLAASGGEVEAVVLDVSDAAAVAHAVRRAEARFGRIDKLVNVAGIQRLGPLLEFSPDDFDATFAINVRGVFLMTQAVAKGMAARRSGAIVTISSNAAVVPRVRQGAYCASKAAVSHLMRVFALELGPLGIRCNAVLPGATETAMIRRMMDEMGFGEEMLRGSLDGFRVGVPLGRIARIDDVANAVAFLLSDQASHITMHGLVVDGGSGLGA